MFYIGTKRGFVRSITSSGLLNETVDARSAMSYPSRNSAIADAAQPWLYDEGYCPYLGRRTPFGIVFRKAWAKHLISDIVREHKLETAG